MTPINRLFISLANRPAFLYHGTMVERLYEILEENAILANTRQTEIFDGVMTTKPDWAVRKKDFDSRGYLKGVSLTRNKGFALQWANSRGALHKVSGPEGASVILVLDQNKLRQNFRMIPIMFWSNRNTKHPESGPHRYDESEEFLIGSIRPLSKYLVEVLVPQETFRTNPLLKDIKDTPGLFSWHPKIIVI